MGMKIVQRRWLPTTIAVLCAVSLSCGDSPFEKEKFGRTHEAMALIASVGYGDTAQTIGMRKEIAFGPQSFAVTGNGEVYILDSVQQAVKRFSPEGMFVESIPIDCRGDDLAVDDEGNVYVVERNTQSLHVFGADGKKRGSFVLNEKGFISPLHLRIQDDAICLVNLEQEEAVIAQKSGARITAAKIEFQPGQAIAGGDRVRTARTEARRGVVEIVGGKKAELPFDNIASISFLGQDEAGLLYIQIETFRASGIGVDLHVVCLNRSLEVVSAVRDIPNQYAVWIDRLLYLTPKGDIYQVLPDRAGVLIHVWKKDVATTKGGRS